MVDKNQLRLCFVRSFSSEDAAGIFGANSNWFLCNAVRIAAINEGITSKREFGVTLAKNNVIAAIAC